MTVTKFHGMALIASGALALLVSGCGSDDNSGDQSGFGSRSSNGPVAMATVDGKAVLADADGHTLYSADVEKDGHIRCVDSCTSFWEPVLGSASDIKAATTELKSELGVVDRPDGASQLTYEDLPLYTFAEEGAGELRGEGFTDDFQGTHFVWSVATSDSSAATSPSETSDSPDDSGGGGGGYGY